MTNLALNQGLSRSVAGVTEPVSLASAKSHLRVSGTDEDALISSMIKTAREWCETYCGRCFIDSTYTLTMSGFPDGPIVLPYGRVRSIESVKYHDENNSEITLSGYRCDTNSRIPYLAAPSSGWPSALDYPGSITVVYKAGPTESNVVTDNPSVLVSAMLLLIDHFYANRGAVASGYNPVVVPYGVEALLSGQKTGWI